MVGGVEGATEVSSTFEPAATRFSGFVLLKVFFVVNSSGPALRFLGSLGSDFEGPRTFWSVHQYIASKEQFQRVHRKRLVEIKGGDDCTGSGSSSDSRIKEAATFEVRLMLAFFFSWGFVQPLQV